MGTLFIVSLMAILSPGEVPAAECPILTIHPGAKLSLSHVKIGDQSFIEVETDDVTFKAKKLRLVNRKTGLTTDLNVVDDMIEIRTGDTIERFGRMTYFGRTEKNE